MNQGDSPNSEEVAVPSINRKLSVDRLHNLFFIYYFFFSLLVSQEAGDDIISKKSLLAVKESVKFLKENARAEGLFRRSGRRELRRQILSALKRGGTLNLQQIHGDGALECAAALQLFLSHLKKPVVPFNIQQLILADNPGIAADEVARDALGLIRQDVRGRHGELLADLLDLLSHLTQSAPPSECSELQGSPLPVALLPVFFNLTADDLLKWRQLASRFSELITGAPERLLRNSIATEPRDNRETDEDDDENEHRVESSRIEESERIARFRELALLYPIIRLAEQRNTCQIGEMARALVEPLRSPPAGRLHPAMSYLTR